MSIRENLDGIRDAIRAHAAGREVTLVAVSKYATVAQMREAYAAGVRDFGENKVQDALEKMAAFPSEEYPDLRWHFIGNLQTNKAKKTVGRFALVHAIDSLHQAEALSRANEEAGATQALLLQVNLGDDPSRHGLAPDQARPMLESVMGLKGIRLRGLMTMAPAEASLNTDQKILKGVFSRLRDMRDGLQAEFGIQLPDLSMGMSHDFIPALECGATIIRIGNLIFKT